MPTANFKSSKAQRASSLCRLIGQARGLHQKRSHLPALNELFPDIVCRIDDDGRMRVFFLADRMQLLPKTLNFAAHWVEAVHSNGTSRVIKDQLDGSQIGKLLLTAGIELEAFGHYRFKLPEPRSAWERLMDDDL